MERGAVTRAYLALGSNIGNRRENLRLALRWLSGTGRVTAVSSLYRSRAVVPEGQGPGPDYMNAACAIETELGPGELLAALQAIERAIGRRPAARWAPRPIDIDILLYGEEAVGTPEVQIPHPLLAERDFALVPLAEIAPEATHPTQGRSIAEIAEDVDIAGLEHIEEPGWEDRPAPAEEAPNSDREDADEDAGAGPDGALT
jgi:2-amino-4-hydroxy-6-hydroxymethyldihydropteridine diphosphokinase